MVRALLERPDDHRTELVITQVAEAGRVDRSNPDRSSFEMRLPHTTAGLDVDLPRDFFSGWQAVRVDSGTRCEFAVEIGRSGIFRCLRGRTDGEWPRRWSVPDDELARLVPAALPAFVEGEACLRRLRPLVGDAPQPGKRLVVGCTDPADDDALARVEAEHGASLPASYRQFLLATDGLLLGDEFLHGTVDAYPVDLEGARWWVIASIYGVESIVVPADGDDGPVLLWPHDASRDQAQELAADFASFLRESLARGRMTP